jgi:hypothetical protein
MHNLKKKGGHMGGIITSILTDTSMRDPSSVETALINDTDGVPWQ